MSIIQKANRLYQSGNYAEAYRLYMKAANIYGHKNLELNLQFCKKRMGIQITPRDVVLLIPTCVEYSNKTEAIRNTWARHLTFYGFRYLFLVGRPELEKSIQEGDVLYVPCKDDYESLLLKLVLGYEYLYHKMNFTYVYKIDDDCFPDLEKLQDDILPQLSGQKYSGGAIHPIGEKMNAEWHFGKCSDQRFNKPYKFDLPPFDFAKGGYGYFLHKEILPLIYRLKDKLKNELDRYIYSYEDVRIAEILYDHKIFVSPLDNYSIVSASKYKGFEHYLVYDIKNTELMEQIYRDKSKGKNRPYHDGFLNDYFDHIYVVNLKYKVMNRLIVAQHLKKHGINFELFEATDGYVGEPFNKYKEYKRRPLGELKRYSEYSEHEQRRGHAYIESAGAFGYIYTYLRILSNAKKKGYGRFLILEDDVMLVDDFESKFKDFIQRVDEDWKILQLGASQYGWRSVDIEIAKKNRFYFPRRIDTCGSFAIAFDTNIIDELIEVESTFEAPFDHLTMGELYERYLGKCFVAYPNIVIPDVVDSTIRKSRNQYSHSEKMKWDLKTFDFPLSKPSISVVINGKNNLKYYTRFSRTNDLPFSLRLFFNSKDGLRPLHNIELLDIIGNEIQSIPSFFLLPVTDYLVTLDVDDVLTEDDIVKFIEYKTSIRNENTTPLRAMRNYKKKVKEERVSVIIPTYRRPKNLRNALASVVMQDYHDIEIIVVSDNGNESEFIDETREVVSSFDSLKANTKIIYIEHSINRNGSAARNTGILYSTGGYICFLDDDDIYLQGRISKSIAALAKTTKTTGAVYCGYYGWNSKESDENRYKKGNLTREILLLEYNKHYLYTNSATYKREAVMRLNGFDESYRRHQDLEFNLRFFEHYTIAVVRECLVHMRPDTTDVDNRVFDLEMLGTKKKFLNQFSYIIDKFDQDLVKSIYDIHWAEAKRYISNMDNFVNEISKDPKEGLIHILKERISHH